MAANLHAVQTDELVGEVNRRMEELQTKENRLEEMEQRLFAVVKNPEDVLEINAGGQVFAVRRSTLCLATDSLLASLFSGDWDEGQARDSQGRPFLDLDPYLFGKIVNFLRQKSIEGPDRPAPRPKTASDKAEEFECVVEYYGLNDCLYGCKSNVNLKVQSFSSPGAPWQRSVSKFEPRGYKLRLTAPIRLRAVLIGVPVPVQVAVGYGTSQIVKEVQTEAINSTIEDPLWKGGEAAIQQIAHFHFLQLQPQDAFIVMKLQQGTQYSYVDGNTASRDAGPFSIQSKVNLPLADNTHSVCMRIVYAE